MYVLSKKKYCLALTRKSQGKWNIWNGYPITGWFSDRGIFGEVGYIVNMYGELPFAQRPVDCR